MADDIREKVIIGVVVAVILAALTFLWYWTSEGGLIRVLGGITEREAVSEERVLKLLDERLQGRELTLEEVNKQIDARAIQFLPAAMVVVSTVECKHLGPGWLPFREGTGRFLIGAGTDTLGTYKQWSRALPGGGFEDVDLSTYEVLSTAGEEHHQLSENEMPGHRHIVYWNAGEPKVGGVVAPGAEVGGPERSMVRPGETGQSGGTGQSEEAQSHNNMPPYVAAYFCTRSRV